MPKKWIIFTMTAAVILQAFPAAARESKYKSGAESSAQTPAPRPEHADWLPGHEVDNMPSKETLYVNFPGTWEGFFYLEGLFYRQVEKHKYVVVDAPVGIVVPILPRGASMQSYDGVLVYNYKYIDYVQDPKGYRVIDRAERNSLRHPSVSLLPAVQPAPAGGPENYDIYVPNRDGSFTLVSLKKTGQGFVGPQGELYPEYPTVEKLKLLYEKK